MIQWIQVAGYAGDLQAAYDYFVERGGSVAAERFLMRYERTLPRSSCSQLCGARSWLATKADSEFHIQRFLG